MNKLVILAISIGGFVFAGTWNNNTPAIEKSAPVKSQFCMAEDTSDDDNRLERKRGGKRNKGRRKGGNGLR